MIVDAGHETRSPSMRANLIAATDRFATHRW